MGFEDEEVARLMIYDKTQVREAVSLVDVVSQYVKLKPSGREWIGCCPFHNDRTPSLNVRDTTRTFKCFGCGASGDVFSFLMMAEGLTFTQAVEALGKAENIVASTQTPSVLQRKLTLKPREEVKAVPQHLKNRRAYGSLAYLAAFVPPDVLPDFEERAAVMQFDVLGARSNIQFRGEAAGLAILQNSQFLDDTVITQEVLTNFESINPFIVTIL